METGSRFFLASASFVIVALAGCAHQKAAPLGPEDASLAAEAPLAPDSSDSQAAQYAPPPAPLGVPPVSAPPLAPLSIGSDNDGTINGAVGLLAPEQWIVGTIIVNGKRYLVRQETVTNPPTRNPEIVEVDGEFYWLDGDEAVAFVPPKPAITAPLAPENAEEARRSRELLITRRVVNKPQQDRAQARSRPTAPDPVVVSGGVAAPSVTAGNTQFGASDVIGGYSGVGTIEEMTVATPTRPVARLVQQRPPAISTQPDYDLVLVTLPDGQIDLQPAGVDCALLKQTFPSAAPEVKARQRTEYVLCGGDPRY